MCSPPIFFHSPLPVSLVASAHSPPSLVVPPSSQFPFHLPRPPMAAAPALRPVLLPRPAPSHGSSGWPSAQSSLLPRPPMAAAPGPPPPPPPSTLLPPPPVAAAVAEAWAAAMAAGSMQGMADLPLPGTSTLRGRRTSGPAKGLRTRRPARPPCAVGGCPLGRDNGRIRSPLCRIRTPLPDLVGALLSRLASPGSRPSSPVCGRRQPVTFWCSVGLPYRQCSVGFLAAPLPLWCTAASAPF